MNSKKQMLKKLLQIVLITIIVINLFMVMLTGLGINDNLKYFPFALLEVESGSMEPEYSVGDVLLVYETDFENLKIGDNVTFHLGTELVTHKIVDYKDGKYITKGLANNLTDYPIGNEEYCAKAILCLPNAGFLLNIFDNPIDIVLLLLLLIVVFYAVPLLNFIYSCSTKKIKIDKVKIVQLFKQTGKLRFCAFVCLFSCVFTTPYLTAAKYIAMINAYAPIYASTLNFTSNLLDVNGKSYSIEGWSTTEKEMLLQIKNYSNELLFNKLGQDVCYKLYVIPENGDDLKTYGTDYTVQIENSDNIQPPIASEYQFPDKYKDNTIQAGPFLLSGNNEQKTTQNFKLKINLINNTNTSKKKLKFKVVAASATNKQFFIENFGEFEFSTTESKQFLAVTKEKTDSMVMISVKTDLIDDSAGSMKYVRFNWPKEKVYINEFESTAFNIINNYNSEYYSKDNGYIIVPMQAFSSANLQFFIIKDASFADEWKDSFSIVAYNSLAEAIAQQNHENSENQGV